MQESNLQSRSFLGGYLRYESLRMFFGHVTAIILGLVATLITLLVGPSLQLLVTRQTGEIPWRDLVSDRLAWIPVHVSGTGGVSAARLFESLPWLLVGVAAVKALIGAAQWYTWESLGERVSRRIRHDLMGSYVLLSPEARRSDEGRKVDASMATAVSNDVRMLREYIVHFHGGFPREGLQVLFLGFTLAVLSPKLFLSFMCGLVPAAVVIRKFGKRLRGRTAKVLSETAGLGEWVQQRMLGFETIKHFGTERRESEQLRQLNQTLLSRMVRAARLRARTSPVIEVFGFFAMVVILYIALDDVRSGNVSGAVLISFFSSMALFAQSAAKLGKYFNSNKEGMAAVERLSAIASFMRANQLREVAATLGDKKDIPVSCEGLVLRYPGASRPALDDVALEFRRGRFYGIGGGSGAGKSSLFKVILGLVEPDKGRVGVSGKICYMPQSVQLMSATLLENICYPDPSGDVTKAAHALREVGIGEFEGRLGEALPPLSGGQAQRILLARLIYHSADIILVDEGTSALDPGLEQVVYGCLKGLAKEGACVIMIAHRIPALESTDEIIVMESGRVVERGTVKNIRQSPAFSRLVAHEAP